MIALDTLRQLLLTANQDPWIADEFEYMSASGWHPGGDNDWFVHNGQYNLTGNSCDATDARYIAAACPCNIREILDFIDHLQQTAQMTLDNGGNQREALEYIAGLIAQRKQLEEK